VYTRLDAFQPRAEEKEYVVSITPDYVTIEYECLVWTHFVEQMDSVLEAINFASRTYWGDKIQFQFFSDIESFEDNLTYEVGEERVVRTSFNITLNGYLIPNSINKEMAVSNRTFGISKVVFGMELAGTEAEVVSARNKPKSKQAASVVSADSTNITVINQSGATFDPVIVAYLNTNKEQQGTYISSNKVSFGQWLAAPSTLPATSIDNFIFSCNGQLIEKSAITSFSEVSGGSELTVNIPLLGYSFESDDVIIAIGKFA
jgi:hypothetical protein